MVHISELENRRVEKVEDVVSIGDEIIVKVLEIDNQGKIRLSRKAALAEIEAKKKTADKAEYCKNRPVGNSHRSFYTQFRLAMARCL